MDGRRRAADARVSGQRGLDLAQLDPEAAELDLRVAPAQELHHAVGAPPAEISGAVHPFARSATGPGHEPGGGRAGLVQVAVGQAGAADVELAGPSRGHRAEVGVQDLHLLAQGVAAHRDRAALGVGDRHLVGGGGDHGLHRSVPVDQTKPGVAPEQPGRMGRRGGVATGEHSIEVSEDAGVLVDQVAEQAGRGEQRGDPVPGHEVGDDGRVGALPGLQDHGTPEQQGAEQLQHERIPGDRRRLHDGLTAAEASERRRGHTDQQGTMIAGHGLGSARRAGGEHDAREVVGAGSEPVRQVGAGATTGG